MSRTSALYGLSSLTCPGVVHIVESPDDVDLLADAGYAAVCPRGESSDWSPILGRDCVIVSADGSVMAPRGANVRSCRSVRPAAGQSASDHLISGYGVDDWVSAPPPRPAVLVSALLAAGLPPRPKPSIVHRSDGRALFYSHAVNSLFGPAESGKTKVALAAVVDVLNNGGRVAYVDLDANGIEDILEQVQELGADPDALAADMLTVYEPLTGTETRRLCAGIACAGLDLVVIDSMYLFVPMLGASSNSADEFVAVFKSAVTPIANSGACVILIDHTGKSAEASKFGAGGTMAKRAVVDGVSLRVESRTPLKPNAVGISAITLNKDRHGGVREHAAETEPRADHHNEALVAMFELDSTGPGRMVASFLAPSASTRDAVPDDPTAARRRESPAERARKDVEYLRSMDVPPITIDGIKDALTCSYPRARRALDLLIPRDTTPEPESGLFDE